MLNISPAPVSAAGLISGTITRVQSTTVNSGSAASVTSLTLTFGASLTVGNLLVVAFGLDANNSPRILDAGGSLELSASTAINTTNTTTCHIASCPITTAGTTVTVSIVAGATAFAGGAIGVEYSGAKLRPDTPASRTANTGTTQTTGTIITPGANDLLLAAFAIRSTYASEQTAWFTVTAPFASVGQTSSFINVANADRGIALAERFVSAAGSYSASGTQANAQFANLLLSFVSD